MINGMLGRKIGMTQVFKDNGDVIPVTVVQLGPMTVVQKKTLEKDQYESVQMGFEDIAEKKINMPLKGHFKTVKPKRILREFKVHNLSQIQLGQSFDVTIFEEGEDVTVTGTSKGKGFAGVMKRHGFRGQPASHGHRGHRMTGSIGQCATPGRVFKGKKMHGHQGHAKVTTKGLKIVKIIPNEQLALISGALPGPNGSLVTVCKTLFK